MITTTIPKDSLLKRIESDSTTRSFYKTLKNELRNLSLPQFRKDLHERLTQVVANSLNSRAYGLIAHLKSELVYFPPAQI